MKKHSFKLSDSKTQETIQLNGETPKKFILYSPFKEEVQVLVPIINVMSGAPNVGYENNPINQSELGTPQEINKGGEMIISKNPEFSFEGRTVDFTIELHF